MNIFQKRSVNTLSDFVRISFKNISESDHDLHFPIYSKQNQQTVTKFHYILDLGSFVGAGRLFKYYLMEPNFQVFFLSFLVF